MFVDLIQRTINILGYSIVKVSPDVQILNLLNRLKPVQVDLIRVGGDGDGGYLIPDDINGIERCFSPGTSDIANFESEMLERNIPCYLADGSVDKPPISHPKLFFEKKFVGTVESEDTLDFQKWIESNSNSGEDLILQMNIEGSEYACILGCDVKVLNQFRVIVVEFHFLEKIFDQKIFPIFRDTFLKLLDNYHVVHIHPNNSGGLMRVRGIEIPRTMEFTFLRKDRVAEVKHAARFPHPLDRKSVLTKPDFPLPRSWYF